MTLHKNPALFSELITLSADILGMGELHIEKYHNNQCNCAEFINKL